MTKTELINKMTVYFSNKGFLCKSNHYYKEVTGEMTIVFGIHFSSYGGCCYLEYGYSIKSLNNNIPYPRFNELNLNCGRVMTNIGKAIVFENTDEKVFIEITKAIDEIVDKMVDLAKMGRDTMIQHYLSERTNQSWYILGKETADYFGMPVEAFRYHFVKT